MLLELIELENKHLSQLKNVEYFLSQVVFKKPTEIELNSYENYQVNKLFREMNRDAIMYPNISTYLKMQWLFNYHIRLCEDRNIELK